MMKRQIAPKADMALNKPLAAFIIFLCLTITSAFLTDPAYSGENIRYRLSRFVSDENTVIDTRRGIMWPKNFHPFNLWTTLAFEQAEGEVQKLKDICYLGYCDWRMPTERDFKGIIDQEYINPALIYPNPFENVETHYPYWTQNPIQELAAESGICANYFKVVRFWAGEFEQQNRNEGALLIPNRIHDPDKYYSR